MQITRRLAINASAALLVAGVAAAPASAATLKGTVVHRNAHAHSFVVAMSHGRLAAIHATTSPRPGRIVRVSARLLRNGTYAARSVRTVGQRRHVQMRGTVTYSHGRIFTLSSRGASILVRRGARAVTASDTAPPAGSVVLVDGNVDDNGDVQANDVTQEGQDNNGIDLEGKVLGIDTAARTLSISADDEDASGAALTVNVPAGVDMTGFTVGQQVELTVTRNPDGTFVLQQGTGDDNEQEADHNNNNDGSNSSNSGSGSTDQKGGGGGDD
ncbi:MAG: hypothetical protein JWO74_735 [Solirubrobacterales bacterium]|nr:hypothetical protein [Solirubrobacterales bacterium]